MKCPVCPAVELAMSARAGIEIDYCPQCRGIWLDRGELDKIIEHSTTQGTLAGLPVSQRPMLHQDSNYHHSSEHGDNGNHFKTRHERKSFWSELFD